MVLLVGFLPISSFKSCPRVGGIQTAGAETQAPHESSRPPVGGPSLHATRTDAGTPVSSRAPVWGASDTCFPGGVISVVSSRAPVWGASC